MANTLKIKRSNIAGRVPTSIDLDVGELAINFPDKKIFTKDPAGQIIELGGSGCGDCVWKGTQAEFNALPAIDSKITYILTDINIMVVKGTAMDVTLNTAFDTRQPPVWDGSTIDIDIPQGAPYTYDFAQHFISSSAATYQVSSGALPAGMTLSTLGALSGTPTAKGQSTFTIEATNPHGSTDSMQISLDVQLPPFIITVRVTP